MKHVESAIGEALTLRFRVRYQQFAQLWCHVPNGVVLRGSPAQRAMQMARLKKEGLTVGWPDYQLLVPRGKYHGLMLEIKAPKKRPTPEQLTILAALSAQGYMAEWAAGFEDSWAIVENYMQLGEYTA